MRKGVNSLLMNNTRLNISLGTLPLKNPLICGSGEHLIEEAGILKALEFGAAAVVAKSTNESELARRQLDRTDYSIVGQDLKQQDWRKDKGLSTSLFGRSGLMDTDSKEWLSTIARLDGKARKYHSYVVASLIPASMSFLIEHAEIAQKLGIRVLEINIGAPHGIEASRDIRLTFEPEKASETIREVRKVFHGHLWAKTTGMSESISQLAFASKEAGADAVVMMGRMMALIPNLDSMMPVLGTKGAYGGRWALPITCRWLSESRHLLGSKYPLIGTNGARDGYDIARMMLAGATAVEQTSAIFTGGFEVIKENIKQLEGYLKEKEMNALDLIGITSDQVQSYAEQELRPGYWRQFVSDDALNKK